MKDLIINFTPTGQIPTKEQNEFLPVTVQEVITDVLEAYECGISMVHLHARDPKTHTATYSKDIYAEIISGIRKFAPELIICVSLSGRTVNCFSERTEVLELEGALKPDMGSLTLSSLNFNSVTSINTPEMIQNIAQKMLNKKIKPELEVFDVGMINYARYLIDKGLIKPPHYFNLLFGNVACAQAELLHMGNMERDIPNESLYSFGGVGRFQQKVTSVAVASGAGVRIGLEDNLWLDNGRTKLAKNIELVQRIHRLAKENERTVMTSCKLRKLLGLNEGVNGKYGVKCD